MKRWLPFSIWLSLMAGIILCADRGLINGFLSWLHDVPCGDKAGHLLLVGSLALLLNHALGHARVSILSRRILLGGTLIAIVITLEEISQIWIPSRHFDWGDLAANFAGIYLAGLIGTWPGISANGLRRTLSDPAAPGPS